MEDAEEQKKSKPKLSSEEQAFFDNVVKEMDVQRSFQNNEGRPDDDLKLLDATALEQLESCLSVDDQ